MNKNEITTMVQPITKSNFEEDMSIDNLVEMLTDKNSVLSTSKIKELVLIWNGVEYRFKNTREFNESYQTRLVTNDTTGKKSAFDRVMGR